MIDRGRADLDRHVFTFRVPPARHELDDWIAVHVPGAEIRPGGGIQVLIDDWKDAFHFALVWRGSYSTSYHPDAHSSRPPSLHDNA